MVRLDLKKFLSIKSLRVFSKRGALCFCIYVFGYLRFDLRWLAIGLLTWYMFKIWRQYRGPKEVQKEVTPQSPITRYRDVDLPSWVVHPDMQRVEWFNKVFQQLWPHVEMYLVKVLRAVEEDTQLKNRLAGYHIKYLKFPNINLGSIPPRISGVKVHNSVHRDEIMIDFCIEYFGDLCIQMELAFDSFMAQTPKATSSISNLSLTSSSLRMHLRPLLTDVPFVGAVTICFLQPPEIDFDLGGIASALDFPGISLLLRHVIQDQLEQTIVLPNSMTIELVPENDRKKRPSILTGPSSPTTNSTLILIPAGVINVEIVEAKGLVNKDLSFLKNDKSDPYAVVELKADGEIHTFKTEVIQNNLNPVWKMLIDLPVDNPETLDDISIHVFDEDTYTKDEFLGKCTIPVQTIRTAITSAQTQDVWKLLEGIKSGTLHAQVGWSELKLSRPPDSSPCHKATLVVIVDSCNSLLGGRTGLKLPNARVKVEVCGVIQFTDTVIGSVDPVFSHRMSFLVADPVSDSLIVTVEDDRGNKQVLGTLRINLSDVLERTSLSLVNHRFPLTSRILKGVQCPEIILSVAVRYIHRPKTQGFGVHKSLHELQKIMASTVSPVINPRGLDELNKQPDQKLTPTQNEPAVPLEAKFEIPFNGVDHIDGGEESIPYADNMDSMKHVTAIDLDEIGSAIKQSDQVILNGNSLQNGFVHEESPSSTEITNGHIAPFSPMTTVPPHGKLVKIEVPQTPEGSGIPAALSDYKVKTTEAQKFVRANSVSGSRGKSRIEDRRPKIQLSLKYSKNSKMLSVVVHKIKNLDETNHTSLPSPYVKIRILERGERKGSNRRIPNTKRKTKSQKHTASPVFEETLEYCLLETDLSYRRLEVSVWHDSRLSMLGFNTVLGRCIVSLDDLATYVGDKKSEGATLTDWHILFPDLDENDAHPNIHRNKANTIRTTLPRRMSLRKRRFGSKTSLSEVEVSEMSY